MGQSIGRDGGGPVHRQRGRWALAEVLKGSGFPSKPQGALHYVLHIRGDLCLNPSKGRETSPLESCFMIHAQLTSLGSNGE